MLGDKSRNRKNKTGGINVDNQKRAYLIGGLAVAVVLAVIIWFVCAGETSIHDLRYGADAVRNQLSESRESIADAEERAKSIEAGLDRSTTAITNSQSAIGNSLDRIDSIQARTATIEAGLAEVERELAESQSIVRSIRKGN